MSAITGIGDCLTIVFSAQIGPRLGDLVDLVHGRLEIGGLGLGHRLHGHGCPAADRHAADEDLALGCHADIVTAGLPRNAVSAVTPFLLAAAVSGASLRLAIGRISAFAVAVTIPKRR
jgi:hypothetical protein